LSVPMMMMMMMMIIIIIIIGTLKGCFNSLLLHFSQYLSLPKRLCISMQSSILSTCALHCLLYFSISCINSATPGRPLTVLLHMWSLCQPL
jgi:hypothetical protein